MRQFLLFHALSPLRDLLSKFLIIAVKNFAHSSPYNTSGSPGQLRADTLRVSTIRLFKDIRRKINSLQQFPRFHEVNCAILNHYVIKLIFIVLKILIICIYGTNEPRCKIRDDQNYCLKECLFLCNFEQDCTSNSFAGLLRVTFQLYITNITDNRFWNL